MIDKSSLYQKKLNSIEIEFYQLHKDNPDFEFILFPEKIENQIGYFRDLPAGNLLGRVRNIFY